MFFDLDKATDETRLKVKCLHLGCTTEDEYESFAELSFNDGRSVLIVGSKREIWSVFDLPKQRIEKFVVDVFEVVKKPELQGGPVALTTFNQAEIDWQSLPVSGFRHSGKIVCSKSSLSSKRVLEKLKSTRFSTKQDVHSHSVEIHELLKDLFEEVKKKASQ